MRLLKYVLSVFIIFLKRYFDTYGFIKFRVRISNIRLKQEKNCYIIKKNYSPMETNGSAKLQLIFKLITCIDKYCVLSLVEVSFKNETILLVMSYIFRV